MGHSNNWFSVHLDKPYVVIPSSTSSEAPSETAPTSTPADSDPDRGRVKGTVVLHLTKQTKVKSLSIVFSGLARTAFYFDASRIQGSKECVATDKSTFSCSLVHETESLIVTEPKNPLVLPTGTHTFPFFFAVHESLPAVVSSRPICINYQVTASLQLMSLLPFTSPYQSTKPVILIHKDEDLNEDLFNTSCLRFTSKTSERFSGQVSFPCKVLPQSGTVPLMLNLSLKGNATSVKRLTIELLESIYVLAGGDEAEPSSEILVDERLVSRQNCPLQNWPTSTVEEPVTIPKRLMFKIPQAPLNNWSNIDWEVTPTSYRASLEKGFCHTSGRLATANTRVAHCIRISIQLQGLTCDQESEIEFDSAENEIEVMIVGHQEYKDDESHPPSYYRSFTTELVDGAKIHEIDRQAIEALQDELPHHAHCGRHEGGNTMQLPSYNDIFACASNSSQASGSSSASSSRVTSWTGPSQISLDQYSLAESTGSQDSYYANLAAYTARYSNGSAAVYAS
ncbi:hypothetical protein EMPS_00924 [Entomortierella parvispora]|uniref:Arrestin-like N-terminal domain-containing protein n=1 Tax=Entomortierella parvispora TaxID=205924 RepID=A0A9P3H2K7_9FUNG|nr:hypothetical protein EMPS_00924 [Entomortierella parvispora]